MHLLALGKVLKKTFLKLMIINSTLSHDDELTVIAAWIAEIQTAWIARSYHPMMLDARFPTGMTARF